MAAGDEYRARAAEFLAKAQSEADPKRMMEFANLAAAYERLAGQAERNIQVDLVYEAAVAAPAPQATAAPTPAPQTGGDPPPESA